MGGESRYLGLAYVTPYIIGLADLHGVSRSLRRSISASLTTTC